jgi:hypothetical protein
MGKEKDIANQAAIVEIDLIMAAWRKDKTTSDRGENRRYDKRRYKEYK